MLDIKNLDVVDAGLKQLAGFLETNAMSPLVREVLRVIPRELHGNRVSRRAGKSQTGAWTAIQFASSFPTYSIRPLPCSPSSTIEPLTM